MKRPQSRIQEIREQRGFTKAQLSRISGMPPQTLQRIEDGSTKTISPKARKLLAPALRVREDQLLVPVGFPIEPLPGEEPTINEYILEALRELVTEVRSIKSLLEEQREVEH